MLTAMLLLNILFVAFIVCRLKDIDLSAGARKNG